VVFSSVTDYGTVLGFVRENAIPVFADTAPGSINVDLKTIEAAMSDRTRAVVVVHKTGLMADMDPIVALAKRRGCLRPRWQGHHRLPQQESVGVARSGGSTPRCLMHHHKLAPTAPRKSDL